MRPPIPLDSLLILKREGTNLVLLDKLSAEDGTAAIKWNGAQSIHSNPDLILEDLGFQGDSRTDVDPVTGDSSLSSYHASWASQLLNP